MIDLAPETPTSTPQKPSPEIMQKLGLSDALVDKVIQEKAERAKNIGIARTNGAGLYKTFMENPEGTFTSLRLPSGAFNFSPIHSPQELITTIKERISMYKDDYPKEELNAAIEGFAEEALKATDIVSAIDSLDFVSERGILANPAALEKIKTILSSNPEKLVDAAIYLEQLKQKSASESRPAPPPNQVEFPTQSPIPESNPSPAVSPTVENPPVAFSPTPTETLAPAPAPPVGSPSEIQNPQTEEKPAGSFFNQALRPVPNQQNDQTTAVPKPF